MALNKERLKQELTGTSRRKLLYKDLSATHFVEAAPLDAFRNISQNFSPAGVTSPFVARAIPTDSTSVVPVSGR